MSIQYKTHQDILDAVASSSSPETAGVEVDFNEVGQVIIRPCSCMIEDQVLASELNQALVAIQGTLEC